MYINAMLIFVGTDHDLCITIEQPHDFALRTDRIMERERISIARPISLRRAEILHALYFTLLQADCPAPIFDAEDDLKRILTRLLFPESSCLPSATSP